ncbi:MAG: CPBP family intramembrane metalloprotease [Deltaproteobacteria bacterium]|nr:CPBP family intramembrane metalloprotease [Deltaproteobacteria bacterium]
MPEALQRERILAIWRQWTAGLRFRPVFVIVAATVLLILFHENGSSSFFRIHLAGLFGPGRYAKLYPAFYWYACSFAMLCLVPIALGHFVLKRPWTEWISLGDWRFGLKAALALYAVFLPVLVAISFLPEFQTKYPLYAAATDSCSHFALHELAYAIYFIGWEFIYRGFMLFGLRPALGYYAVFVQTIPFAIMHFGKPQVETLAAVLAGIILGYLALRARSFWYGWLLHALVAISNDVLAVIHRSLA